MSNAKHTPASWQCKASHVCDSTYDIYNADGNFLTCDDATHEANARLIAASPTLYNFAVEEARAGNIEAKTMLDLLQLGY